jgi:hypothetical protein
VDRRYEVRFPARRSVRVRVLGGSQEFLSAILSEVSGSGLRLLTDCPLPVDATVEIEDGELTWLGEVCYCNAQPDGFTSGIHVEHRLTLTEDLLRLARQLRLERGVAAETQTD